MAIDHVFPAYHGFENTPQTATVVRQLAQIWCKAFEDTHKARRRVASSD